MAQVSSIQVPPSPPERPGGLERESAGDRDPNFNQNKTYVINPEDCHLIPTNHPAYASACHDVGMQDPETWKYPVIGAVVGAVVLAAIVLLVVFITRRKKADFIKSKDIESNPRRKVSSSSSPSDDHLLSSIHDPVYENQSDNTTKSCDQHINDTRMYINVAPKAPPKMISKNGATKNALKPPSLPAKVAKNAKSQVVIEREFIDTGDDELYVEVVAGKSQKEAECDTNAVENNSQMEQGRNVAKKMPIPKPRVTVDKTKLQSSSLENLSPVSKSEENLSEIKNKLKPTPPLKHGASMDDLNSPSGGNVKKTNKQAMKPKPPPKLGGSFENLNEDKMQGKNMQKKNGLPLPPPKPNNKKALVPPTKQLSQATSKSGHVKPDNNVQPHVSNSNKSETLEFKPRSVGSLLRQFNNATEA